MGISVKLQVFEGPLDLLLHLIEKNKVNIYDIPIVEITKQYMDYIGSMQDQDLNIMSEFLVMAATLLDIKARMLLPLEVNEDGEQEDPRRELVQKLLELKMYKYMAYELNDRRVDAQKVMYKPSTIPKEIAELETPVDMSELLADVSLSRLHIIFKSIIRKQEDRIDPIHSKFGRIEKEEINLNETIRFVEQYAREQRKFNFRSLFQGTESKMQVIVTFLAVLELMKLGTIKILQEEIFEDILISVVEKSA